MGGFTAGLVAGCLLGVCGTFLFLSIGRGVFRGPGARVSSPIPSRNFSFPQSSCSALPPFAVGLEIGTDGCIHAPAFGGGAGRFQTGGPAERAHCHGNRGADFGFWFFPPVGSVMMQSSSDRLALALFLPIATLGSRLIGRREKGQRRSFPHCPPFRGTNPRSRMRGLVAGDFLRHDPGHAFSAIASSERDSALGELPLLFSGTTNRHLESSGGLRSPEVPPCAGFADFSLHPARFPARYFSRRCARRDNACPARSSSPPANTRLDAHNVDPSAICSPARPLERGKSCPRANQNRKCARPIPNHS